ncbi:MAG: hypothetical protein CW338_05070 [Clostridiales bacterium]|nr:hypothetical protein [Clostridiales bacterium]
MDYSVLNLLYRCSREFSHEKTRRSDLSDTECMICSYVFSHAGCSQDEIASALRIDKTTVAKALLSLEKKGCVERAACADDRRRNSISLTARGGERIAGLMDIHNEWLSKVLACLSEDEQRRFEDYCVRLLTAAEKVSGR